MPLASIALANYKCFSTKQQIEVRPITVLLGRNNSGKSALARLPLLLQTGVRTDSSEPLDTDASGADVGGAFVDLVHGMRPHGDLEFGLEFELGDESRYFVHVAVQNIDEYSLQVVKLWEVSSDRLSYKLTWDLGSPAAAPRRYRLTWGDQSEDVDVTFRGLLPWRISGGGVPEDALAEILQLVGRIRDNLDTIRYLGPFRHQPERFYRTPSRLPSDIGMQGENAPSILAIDGSRSAGSLMERVNSYLQRSLPDWRLAVERTGTTFSLVLIPEWDENQRINLADTGAGIAQVLPIFIQRAMDAASMSPTATLEIVEQPELHLHPSAHAQLADLYLSASSPTRRFIIETHSETFLLRLRRRVADRTVSASSIGIYFVENAGYSAVLRRINLNPAGELDYWPSGVFSEDFEETKALAAAQFERRSENAS
jgi:hypothetical protein